MLDRSLHATLVPGDPARTSCLALWSAEPGGDPAGEPDDAPTLVPLVLPGPSGVATALRPARLVGIAEVLDDLVDVPLDDTVASPSVRAWALVARVALDLVARARLQPAISAGGHDTWTLGPLDEADRSRRAALAAWLPPTAHCHPSSGVDALRVPSAHDAVTLFCRAVADAMPRTAAAPTVSRQPAWCGREPADVAALRSHLVDEDETVRTVVGLRLSLPVDDEAPFAVALQVRAADDPGRVADAADLWAGRATGFDHHAEADLLLALRRGARLWAPLRTLLDDPAPSAMEVGDTEAMALFGALATDLGGAGIEVLVPAALTRTVRAAAHAEPAPAGEERTTHFDLASVCELTWRATLDGEPLDDAELSALAASRRPLVRLRGQWVVVDPTVAGKLSRSHQLSGADALAAALGGTVVVDGEPVEVSVGAPIRHLADRLRSASAPHELQEPPGLHATLRPYQRRGLAWLHEMVGLGFGGVLADDMGLGKTIQLIALHLQRAELAQGPTLVVCPASLVGNWQRELARFAPGVTTRRYHGAERSLDGLGRRDVVVTTYGVLRRDADALAVRDWDLVVADEAQQVKNPSSATARALRRVPATARLAMTGTPVENRLTELWALLDWTTPGLLGPLETFRRTVAIPVERDRDAATTEHVARLISPFLLRRRKDDPEIAPDLPPKTETDHPVQLSVEQAGLYRAVVEEILEAIERAEGIERRGLVLKLLTALKQICNHPAHYLHQGGPLAGRSGKLDVFDELVGSITDAGDSTLVFTQYVAMGRLLLARLAELGVPAEFLHGSDTLTRRADMVDRFQEGGFPVMVVSLRAGGTGLNLTRATHVIHYDRWWNPAVENQASDRVWRIGQDRPVQIHRLISEGTVEDRIATVLAHKQQLADAVVGGGEAWLTELDDAELAALVRLGDGSR
jgi:superfamily II DNA or RNA helicase